MVKEWTEAQESVREDFRFPLGSLVTDSITQLTGVVIARQEHITQCNSYWVQQKVGKDGKIPPIEQFDEPRLILVKAPKGSLTEKKKVGGINLLRH